RAKADSVKAEASADISTQVLKTFDFEFYKRATQAVQKIDPKKVIVPAETQAAVSSGGKFGRSRRWSLKHWAVSGLVLAAILAGVFAFRSTDDLAKDDAPSKRGYVSFAMQVEGKVSISVDGRRWQKAPERALAMRFGEHRIRFRHRPPKGKVRNASQTITVTERHTKERPLRISFR
ncbi:MAG: hypothetical protein AAFQ82_21580, partial [Myxococcota bacterium]